MTPYVERAQCYISRWLLSNGKTDKVEKIYRKMARMNDLQVTDEAINAFKELNVVKPSTVRLLRASPLIRGSMNV